MAKKNNNTQKLIFLAIVIFIFAIFFSVLLFFIPMTVSYNTTETYTENVPLSYSIVQSFSFVGDIGQITLKNTDDTSGTYNVNFVFTRNDTNQKQTMTKSISLLSGETGVLSVSKSDISIGQMTYGQTYWFNTQTSVLPSQKSVQKTREITSQKQVSLLTYIMSLPTIKKSTSTSQSTGREPIPVVCQNGVPVSDISQCPGVNIP